MTTLHDFSAASRPAETAGGSRRQRSSPTSLDTKSPPGTVLVVEDSLVVRDRLRALIRDAGIPCRTDFAATGAAARAQFERHHPAAVVLDIALPDASGLDLLREFKAQRPETVVVILTNYAFPEFRDRAKAYGSDYFFNKSVEFEKVCEVLRYRLRGPPGPPAPSGGPA